MGTHTNMKFGLRCVRLLLLFILARSESEIGNKFNSPAHARITTY